MSPVIRPEKVEAIAEIKEKVSKASVIVFADYRGLSVLQMTGLRKSLKREGAQISVVKNTLTVRALQELGLSFDEKTFEGPSALIYTEQDAVQLAKAVVKFAGDNENLKVKGGLLQAAVLTGNQVEELAKLPSREELIARAVGAIKAPLTNLVGVVSGPLRGVVYAISSIKDKKSGGN